MDGVLISSLGSVERSWQIWAERHGLDVRETDLGEYIIQQFDETPSHIIAPAVHKSKDDIADLFAEKHGRPRLDDIAALTHEAREVLRQLNGDITRGSRTMSAAQKLAFLQRLLPGITAREVSDAFAAAFDPGRAMFIAELPASDEVPSEAQLLAVGRAAGASGFGAVPVAGDERVPQRRTDGAGRAADVHHLAGSVGEDATDLAVAQDSLQRDARQHPDVRGLGAGGGEEVVGDADALADVGDETHMRPPAARSGAVVARREVGAAHRDQCLGSAP